MKKLNLVLGLLVLLGSTGMASAEEFFARPGVTVAATVAYPGFRVVYRRPGIYCWYGGRFYSRLAWDRYCRLHPYRFANRYRHDRDDRYDRDDRRF